MNFNNSAHKSLFLCYCALCWMKVVKTKHFNHNTTAIFADLWVGGCVCVSVSEFSLNNMLKI